MPHRPPPTPRPASARAGRNTGSTIPIAPLDLARQIVDGDRGAVGSVAAAPHRCAVRPDERIDLHPPVTARLLEHCRIAVQRHHAHDEPRLGGSPWRPMETGGGIERRRRRVRRPARHRFVRPLGHTRRFGRSAGFDCLRDQQGERQQGVRCCAVAVRRREDGSTVSSIRTARQTRARTLSARLGADVVAVLDLAANFVVEAANAASGEGRLRDQSGQQGLVDALRIGRVEGDGVAEGLAAASVTPTVSRLPRRAPPSTGSPPRSPRRCRPAGPRRPSGRSAPGGWPSAPARPRRGRRPGRS